MNQVSLRTPQWLQKCLTALKTDGYCVVTEALDKAACGALRAACYATQSTILEEIGPARLERAGELGVLRLPMYYDDRFYQLLENPALLGIVDATVSDTAVMHLMNAFILPSTAERQDVFQTRFHMDFRRVMNGYMASINTFFTLSDFYEQNGATLLVPGTQQQQTPPGIPYCEEHAVVAKCPAGSMLAFDSTLWHAAGCNRSGADRLSVNVQFTRSYFKQQLDYVRALGDKHIATLPPRMQQLLGWYTRLPCSLDEFYVPANQRLYRGGQG